MFSLHRVLFWHRRPSDICSVFFVNYANYGQKKNAHESRDENINKIMKKLQKFLEIVAKKPNAGSESYESNVCINGK